ncbi:MAG: Slp family lipoprotein [Deferrisomatales bacterium]|nr:Slp family lipoprotein [Deferrisomatales bacterium]
MVAARFSIAVVVATLLLGACSSAITRSDPSTPSADGEFAALSKDPAAAAGTNVALCGKILGIRAAPGAGTILVMLHCSFGQGQSPGSEGEGDGRFAVHYPDRLDHHLFRRGQLVSVGGVVRGEKPETGGAPTDPSLWLDGQKIELLEPSDGSLMTRLRHQLVGQGNQKVWLPWWYDPYYGSRPWWW